MTEAHRRHVHHANDEQLRYLIHENLKVFAKFTSENCAVCSALAPPFAKFVDEEDYQSILFLKLNSDENPVAKKLMEDKVTPFFVSYCQGRLLECDALTMEADMRAQIDRLRDLVPPAA